MRLSHRHWWFSHIRRRLPHVRRWLPHIELWWFPHVQLGLSHVELRLPDVHLRFSHIHLGLSHLRLPHVHLRLSQTFSGGFTLHNLMCSHRSKRLRWGWSSCTRWLVPPIHRLGPPVHGHWLCRHRSRGTLRWKRLEVWSGIRLLLERRLLSRFVLWLQIGWRPALPRRRAEDVGVRVPVSKACTRGH